MTELPSHPDTEHGRSAPDGSGTGAPIRPARLSGLGRTLIVAAVAAVVVLIGVLHLTGVVGR